MMRGHFLLMMMVAAAASCAKAEPVVEKEPVAAAAAPTAETKPSPAKSAASLEYFVVEVEGLTCSGCVWEIKDKFSKLQGVSLVEVNLKGECAVIGYDANQVKPAALLVAFDELRYAVTPVGSERLASTPDGRVQCTGSVWD